MSVDTKRLRSFYAIEDLPRFPSLMDVIGCSSYWPTDPTFTTENTSSCLPSSRCSIVDQSVFFEVKVGCAEMDTILRFKGNIIAR